jgi:hypothetical protein
VASDAPRSRAANDTIVTGEVAVTGWAVNDIGLARVRIYRKPIPGFETDLAFIGDATFVPNARPDVQGAFPGRPQNDQAGWGYMLLSNMLPNGGNGTFTLVIRAEDVEANSATIAERRIVCQNSLATMPFGTIDTPRQGETISGSQYVNFGWALTPQPNMIPPDGSTITVLIDTYPSATRRTASPAPTSTRSFPATRTAAARSGFTSSTRRR